MNLFVVLLGINFCSNFYIRYALVVQPLFGTERQD